MGHLGQELALHLTGLLCPALGLDELLLYAFRFRKLRQHIGGQGIELLGKLLQLPDALRLHKHAAPAVLPLDELFVAHHRPDIPGLKQKDQDQQNAQLSDAAGSLQKIRPIRLLPGSRYALLQPRTHGALKALDIGINQIFVDKIWASIKDLDGFSGFF